MILAMSPLLPPFPSFSCVSCAGRLVNASGNRGRMVLPGSRRRAVLVRYELLN